METQLASEMLINQRTRQRLAIVAEISGDYTIHISNDFMDKSVSLTIDRSEIRHFHKTLEKFNSGFVKGKEFGGLEVHAKQNSNEGNSGPVSLRKHGTGYNYFTFNSGIFLDGRELSYEFVNKSFYEPEYTDIEVLIEWIAGRIYK